MKRTLSQIHDRNIVYAKRGVMPTDHLSFSFQHFKLTSLIVLLVLLSGCAATIPRELEHLNAKLAAECSGEKKPPAEPAEAILVSIESDVMADEWYFEFTNVESKLKYLMLLKPTKFAFPGKDFFSTYRFPPRMYCYQVQPGTYRFDKAYAYMVVTRTTNGSQSTSTEFHEFSYDSAFQVPEGKVTYLGRFIIVDTNMKGKGYFGRMGELMKSTFVGIFTGSMMSNAVEITRVDSLAEDKAWLDGEYDRFHDMAIGNSVREAIAEPRAGTGEVAETQAK